MMENFGFIKVAAAVPSVRVADCAFNAARIEELLRRAAGRGAALAAFPELALTGYTCGDLFGQPALLDAAERALEGLVKRTAGLDIVAVAGMPVRVGTALANCAVVFGRGRILGAVPKSCLPAYDEFYEPRWFAPAASLPERETKLCGQRVPFGSDLLFEGGQVRFGVEICEDAWVPVPPSCLQAQGGAELLVNISASDEGAGKHDYLRSLVRQQSARCMAAYLYVSAGAGESSTDLLFAGNALIAENGELLAAAPRFTDREQLLVCDVDIEWLRTLRRRTNTFRASVGPLPSFRSVAAPLPQGDVRLRFDRTINPAPFVPAQEERRGERCEEIFNIQSLGLVQRLRHTGCRRAVVGISGGLDSTLALLVTVRAFDRLSLPREGIVGITMPGFGTTGRTYRNALELMRGLGVEVREIPIREACERHFADIGLDPGDRGAAYENAQARERTQILMDTANMVGGLVVGTGDLSELALGWATYNGDHMSMYGVNAGVPKTLVRHLVEWYAACCSTGAVQAVLRDIAATPISPELLPAGEDGTIAQCTEELVGPYELHDFFLYHFVRHGATAGKIAFLAGKAFEGRYDQATVRRWLKVFLQRFFSQQFKRSALPDGPKVGSVSLSPRGDWRMPSDASPREWLDEAEKA